MARVSNPMKIITLRIGEEEKARLEQLAERGNVTLSRALREGAALYLDDLQGRLHAARGGRTTLHSVRRDKQGAAVSAASTPTAREAASARRLRLALADGLARIRDSWLADADERVTLAALRTWLGLIGRAYAGDETYIGWSWFLKDYCPGYGEKATRDALDAATRGALIKGPTLDLDSVFEDLKAGLAAMVGDAEAQELVRRAVLPNWNVVERELS